MRCLTRGRVYHRCLFGLFVIAACGKKPDAEVTVGRHDVIMVDPQKQKVRSDGFCDVRFEQSQGPRFEFPELAAAPVSGARPSRWINVWATWCKPCIEELPLLDMWRPRLSQKNIKVDFLSVDKSEIEVQKFVQTHPTLRATVRIKELSLLKPWLKSLGLDEHATIPVHVFVGAHGTVRCARAGGVEEKDWAVIASILAETQ